MRVDDLRERGLIGLGADVGVGGPDQLVAGDAVARRGHARQAQIGGVRQNRREQRVLVVARLAGPQVGES